MLCSVVLQDEEKSGQARSLHIVVLGRGVQWRTVPVWPAHRRWMFIAMLEPVFVCILTKIRHD